MNNVVDTARQEGVKKGLEEGRLAERSLILNRQRSLILRLLSRTVGELTNDLTTKINQLPIEKLEALNEILLDFKGLDDVIDWLKANISTL